MPNARPAPIQLGGHTASAQPRRPVVAHNIDGKVYSTRRATLIHDNGKGEALYADPESGYFILRVVRMLGSVPLLDVLPCSDEKLRQWAAANGALEGVASQTAKVLTIRLLSTNRGSAELARLIRKYAS